MEQFVINREGEFIFALYYDLAQRIGGTVSVMPISAFEKSNSFEELNTDSAKWYTVVGETEEQLTENFKVLINNVLKKVKKQQKGVA